jgi:hypothetical protein
MITWLPLLIVLLLAGSAVLLRFLNRFTPDPMPTNWGRLPDDVEWERAAEQLLHTGLHQMRSTSEKWAGSIAALLGLFSTAALLGGRSTISDLPPDMGNVALLFLILAIVSAVTAYFLASVVAQGIPVRIDRLDGWALKSFHKQMIRRNITFLAWSRFLTISAVIFLACILLITFMGEGSVAQRESYAVVVQTDGTALCGKLELLPDGRLALLIAGKSRAVTSIRGLRMVGQCPPLSPEGGE